MIFDTIGNRENPAIVMLNGSFCTGKGLLPIAKMLSDEYYVILPTYNGHYENGGIFTTRKEQARHVYNYLLSENITELALVHGISMGAEVAMELVKIISDESKIKINRCLFDGGPFLHFSALFRKVMQMKFLKFVKPGKVRTEQQIDDMMKSGIIKFVAGKDTEPYRDMIRDMNCAKYMTKQSVKNESDACYTFDMYEFPESLQKRMVFIWSRDEPAFQSKKNVDKICPLADYRDTGNLGHCGLLVKKPLEYVTLLKETAGAIHEK